jgi:hypothetical protein
LEDEGFYVGPRPYVTNSNLNRMENRLLKEAGRNAAQEDEEAAAGQTIPGVLQEVFIFFNSDWRHVPFDVL